MNVPLKDGIDDDSYAALFKPVMRKLIEVYQPTAVVFQSGKASLRSPFCVIWSLLLYRTGFHNWQSCARLVRCVS